MTLSGEGFKRPLNNNRTYPRLDWSQGVMGLFCPNE